MLSVHVSTMCHFECNIYHTVIWWYFLSVKLSVVWTIISLPRCVFIRVEVHIKLKYSKWCISTRFLKNQLISLISLFCIKLVQTSDLAFNSRGEMSKRLVFYWSPYFLLGMFNARDLIPFHTHTSRSMHLHWYLVFGRLVLDAWRNTNNTIVPHAHIHALFEDTFHKLWIGKRKRILHHFITTTLIVCTDFPKSVSLQWCKWFLYSL